MRTEQEMMELILGIASADDRIRAVYMNGSRTNDKVKKDSLQDFDIVFVVTETRFFYEDKDWVSQFGNIILMQCPEEMDRSLGKHCDFDVTYGWLMIFDDGNRIDLHVEAKEYCSILEDSLCIKLLDKDGTLFDVAESSDQDYWVQRPTPAQFYAVCNEFWWCLNNVAKGLCREEISYAQEMLSYHVRPQLLQLLTWKVGFYTKFQVSVGKSGKYLSQWLSNEEWEAYLETYCGSIVGEMWRSSYVMMDLFDELGDEVAGLLGIAYRWEESVGARKYIDIIRKLL